MKRVFLIVLDSFGIGAEPDAAEFGDEGANTLASVRKSAAWHCPNLEKLGLFCVDGANCGESCKSPSGSFARLRELSRGKDTIIGHWELAGLVSEKPMPTFPHGFPPEVIGALETATGRKCICNKPYSGTAVIADYGEEHLRTGALIVYTSADSVLQIAAHESIVPVEELYRYCEAARALMTGENAVGRVIARPFTGDGSTGFRRTARRHDYALSPFAPTLLDAVQAAGQEVIGVGKIYDIFNGQGISRTYRTTSNEDGMQRTLALAKESFAGLCFVNLVDFDMVYGHRRDVDGYAGALAAFDAFLSELLPLLGQEDVLMLTADHGCDPAFLSSTDHTREYVPWLVYGKEVRAGVNLGTLQGFGYVAGTVCEALGVQNTMAAPGAWGQLKR